MDTGSGMGAPGPGGSWGGKNQGPSFKGSGVSVSQHEKTSGGWLHNRTRGFNTTEVYLSVVKRTHSMLPVFYDDYKI